VEFAVSESDDGRRGWKDEPFQEMNTDNLIQKHLRLCLFIFTD